MSSFIRIMKKFTSLILVAITCLLPLTSFAWPLPDPALDGNVVIDDVDGSAGSKDNFKWLLEQAVEPIQVHLDNSAPNSIIYGGADGVVIFVIDLFKSYIFPLIIVLAILTAIFGFMELMISDTEDKRKKWADYFIWWVVWIIVFISAEFIFNGLYGTIQTLKWWGVTTRNELADNIYADIAFPFLKLAMYLLMAGLFIILLIKSIQYVANPSDKAAEQWRNTIISAAIWIIVITLAKTLVEAVYNKQADITATTIGQNGAPKIFVGKWILNLDANSYQTIFTIINYLLWLIAFVVLCQAYLMLFNANTDDSIKKMRKNLLYIFWWLLLIGLSYLIVNLVALDIN
jgi:hypothetical protein